jgi:general secretion pathway protein L
MSDRILLFITDLDGQALAWYSPGRESSQPERGGWSEFGQFLAARRSSTSSQTQEVVVILSEHGISRLLVPIPSAKRHQAAQALPFALEDLSADDPAQLFTVLADQPMSPGHWPVLLVDAGRRAQVLEHLQAVGVTPQLMVAAADLLPPPDEGTFAVWREPFTDQAVILTGAHQGFVLSSAIGPQLLDRVSQTLTRLASRPAKVQFYLPAEQWADFGHVPPSDWPTDVSLEPVSELGMNDWVTLWQAGLARNQPLSMVTAPRHAQSQLLRRRWGQVAMMAAALLVLVMIWQGGRAWQMAQQADALQAQVIRDFHAALPQTKRLVNARVQLQQALDQLGAGVPQDQFLSALSAFAGVFHPLRQQDSSLAIQSLRFAAQQLTIELTGRQYAALQTVFDRLKKNPSVTVSQIDSGVDDGKAHMRLRIENPASSSRSSS